MFTLNIHLHENKERLDSSANKNVKSQLNKIEYFNKTRYLDCTNEVSGCEIFLQ